MGNIVGSRITSEKTISNIRFIQQSKEEAKHYEWLYQCTNLNSLLNIFESKEIWLTNLKLVNDREEAKRITVPKFEKSYYVACFTYENNIPQEHWEEYCNNEPQNGILLGIKNDCVEKRPHFLCSDGSGISDSDFTIYESFDKAVETALGNRRAIPYHIMDYGFYKIIYDDSLKKKMDVECNWNVDEEMPNGNAITLGLPGIIKNKKGMCYRPGKEPREKNWESEKEIRIKVGVYTSNTFLSDEIIIPRMALPLKSGTFDEIMLRFSPSMSENVAEENLSIIKKRLPNSKIHVLE